MRIGLTTVFLEGEERIRIAATPGRVWPLLAEVTRMGEWSPECRRCEWLDGATEAGVGARFKGYNRIGPYAWTRVCRIVAADPGRELAFVTQSGRGEDQTTWRYHLLADGEGTELIESFENRFVDARVKPWLATRLQRRMRLRQVRRGMRRTLERIKAAAESS